MDGRIREGGCQEDKETCNVYIQGGHVQEQHIMAIRHIIDIEKETNIEDMREGEERKRRRIEEKRIYQISKEVRMAALEEKDRWTFDDEEERREGEREDIERERLDVEEISKEVYMQEREQEFAIWKESERVQDNILLIETFESQLAGWSEGCVYCRISNKEYKHREVCNLEIANKERWEDIKRNVGLVEEWMKREGSFEAYSGCWKCGLPFKICNRWQDIYGDRGKFRVVKEEVC